MSFLDFVFPKRCVVCKRAGSYICENCFSGISFDAKSLCLVCDLPSYNGLTHPGCKTRYSIDGCFSALSYNKLTQRLIYSFKYKPYLTDLETVLGDLFYESIIQNENFNQLMANGKWLMIPIPLSSSKLRKRGYNQSEILTKALAKKLNFKTTNLLKRTRNTQTQVGKSDIERKLNVKNAFEIHPSISSEFLNNCSIILVDDIVTTGSTLKEAAKSLKREGAKQVFGLTLVRD